LIFEVDRFWAEIGIFSFEKAKEIAEKEKERALKTHVQTNQGSSSGFTWVILTTAMGQIAFAEKAYVNLVFLAPKGFLRKDVRFLLLRYRWRYPKALRSRVKGIQYMFFRITVQSKINIGVCSI